jgi:predicted nucleic-acid-binding Zn-ribbon protein
MKHTQRCPKCAHRRFAVIPKYDVPYQRSSNRTEVMPAISVDGGFSDRLDLGWFEVWICERCGLTEWYAQGLAGVYELAQQRPDEVQIIDATGQP